MPITSTGSEGSATPFHEGEQALQRRYGVADQAEALSGTISARLGAGHARFIAAQPFFFITVLDADGLPAMQLVPRVEVPEGVYPLLVITAQDSFCFMLAEAPAQELFAAMPAEGAQAGLIFVDFVQRARLRINGRLHDVPDATAQGFSCPPGHRLLRIAVEQVYANCGARVVRLQARGTGRD